MPLSAKEKKMKRYWIYDNVLTRGGFIDTEKLDAKTLEEAVKEAKIRFKGLTKHDQEKRDEYAVIYADEEDGFTDINTATEWVNIIDLCKREEEEADEEDKS